MILHVFINFSDQVKHDQRYHCFKLNNKRLRKFTYLFKIIRFAESFDSICSSRGTPLFDLLVANAMAKVRDPAGSVLGKAHLFDLLHRHLLDLAHSLHAVHAESLADLAPAEPDIVHLDVGEALLDIADGHDCLGVGLVLRTCYLCQGLVMADPARGLVA